MEVRKLTEEEYAAHVEKFPEDAQYPTLYRLRKLENGFYYESTIIDETTAKYITEAVAFGYRQAQLNMQTALGLLTRK